VAVIVGKVFTCAFGTFMAGHDTKTSLRVGMGLAQIGEFSFIIASLGLSLKVTSSFLYPIAVAVSVLTTLATPYLLRSADGLVGWFDRTAPARFVGFLGLYTQWVGQLGADRKVSFAGRMVRRWVRQMALNVTLIAAVFVIAAFLVRRDPTWLPDFLRRPPTYRALLWLGAVVLSLPLFIATFRKLQALGLLVAEVKVTSVSAGDRTDAIRNVVAQGVPLAGLLGLVLFVLVLSAPLLPPLNVLLVLLFVVAGLTWLLWRSSIHVYSKAQIALEATLSQPPPSRDVPVAPQVSGLLREADLETVSIREGSPAAGKLIRELALRTKSGASVVGIERAGQPLINPGPDEELLPGDQVLLLGSPAQLQAAKAMLG
jgi:CPA2 family monovalent cation:H+ antiporter-2